MRFSQNAQQAAGGKISYFTYDKFNCIMSSGKVTTLVYPDGSEVRYAYARDATHNRLARITIFDDAGEKTKSPSLVMNELMFQ